jgi:hypothetical protein
LHGGAAADSLRQLQIIAHPKLITVPQNRCTGQCEHEAISQLDPAAVATQHRRKPPPNATVIELILRVRSECVEYLLALSFAQPAEI